MFDDKGNGGRSFCLILPKRQTSVIMKAQISIVAHDINVGSKKSFSFLRWLSSENAFFTSIMEENITNRQFLLIFNLMVSFMILIGCTFVSAIPTLISLTYFILSIRLCRKGGLK